MTKYFNNFHLNLKEKLKILKTYDKGDVCCFFSPTIKNVEQVFAKYINMPFAVATTNCTSALFLAYKSLGLTEKDNVIMPNYSHPSTAFALKTCGVKMKFCDSEPDNYNMNINMLNRLVDKNTKAVVFVHLRGYKQNIEQVKQFCEQNNLFLIEDVAQGLGVKINNKQAGSFGDISCFSFNDSKTLQLGEGGMCLFKNQKHENVARIITHEGEFSKRTHLSSTISNGNINDIIYDKFDYIQDGFNFRPFPPIFSILPLKLKKLEKIRTKKHIIRNIYKQKIDKKRFTFLQDSSDDLPICFPILLKNKNESPAILSQFYHSGFPIGKMVYPTLNKIEAFKTVCLNINDNFINSENLYNKLLFLPLSNNITKKMAKNIINFLNNTSKEVKIIKRETEIDNFDGLYIW